MTSIRSALNLINYHSNIMFRRQTKRVAHFLLIPELLYSPPNNAIIQAFLLKGYEVDVFSPGSLETHTTYGDKVKMFTAGYSWAWIIKNIFSLKWISYEWISGTSEDPLAIVAILSFIYRKKSFTLVDEIKAGSYRGDRSDHWKMLCKWGIRRAHFKIVNDKHRIRLLMDYASLDTANKIIVYPGCYVERPKIDQDSQSIKQSWGFPDNAFVIGSSGGFNLTAGADWLLNSIKEIKDLYAAVQPLGVSPLSIFLMENVEYKDRLFIQKTRLSWYEAWKNCIAFDIGLSIYTNPAPQFQKMGVSSNRLCMFIAMGVPVIASRQESFNFLEEYDCGILVSSYNEFKLAIHEIKIRKSKMKDNCEKCFRDYIKPNEYFNNLLQNIDSLTVRK
jgi:hypothetical protein